MRKLIKHLFISCLFLLFLSPMMQAQAVTMVQHHHVKGENRAEFIHRETTYWAEIAKAAIKEGKMASWQLWEKVGGWNMDNSPNFIFVNDFADIDNVNHLNEVWNPTKVFPKGRMQDMNTRGSKASDLDKYLELEKTMWQPFIKQQMESGNSTQISWFSAVKIMPFGQDFPFNAVSVDGFNKLSEAIIPATSYKTEPTFPDFTEINKVHVKQRIQVYRLVKEVH